MTGQDTRPNVWSARLAALTARKRAQSIAALARVRTTKDRGRELGLRAIANGWSARAFDGAFYETAAAGGVSTGVVFVRSREGNTATRNPAALGGGPVDEHLIYEGLSRVAADAVIAGAGTLHPDAFFTVWHPEFVALRAALGRPTHPAQVIMSAEGSMKLDELLLCNLPTVPVYILTSAAGRARLAAGLDRRPWITAIAAASPHEHFTSLRAAGIRRACSVGGRRSATALVDAGLVQDVYLTTTSVSGGEPDTPWYAGTRTLQAQTILAKEWDGAHGPVRFEHLVLTHGQA